MKRLLLHMIALCAAAGICAAPGARADMVTEWNAIAIDSLAAAQQVSTRASRTLAMVHAAVYDAVNAIEGEGEPYRSTAVPGPGASPDAAAAAAAHEVLVDLFPAQKASLDFTYERLLAELPDGQGKQSGVALGEYVGAQMAAWRAGDHSSDVVPYTPGTDPGDWRPTPPGFMPAMTPQWANVTPFAMTDPAQFRTTAPPPLPGAEYAADFNEVKTLGAKNSAARTPEQTEIANFWMDMPGTITTVGRWNEVARFVGEQRGLTLAENARLLALLNIALADAGITAWNYKYHYTLWRPITAIREANTDGNPDTAQDSMWMPLIMTPAFPEYVSAHSTFSAAAAAVLESFFGTQEIYFTIYDFMMPASGRAYTSFAAAAEEAGASRIYGGIHFMSANLDGLAAGRRVGDYVFENFFIPITRIIVADPLTVSAGTPFSLSLVLDKSVTVPVDIYFLADTPYGIVTVSLDGSVSPGIRPLFTGLPGIAAPVHAAIWSSVPVPPGLVPGTYTFYFGAVAAGTAPPVASVTEITPDTPNMVLFDKEPVGVR